MMQGFTFYLKGKDFFIKTARVKKTKGLAIEVLKAINVEVTEGNINYMLYLMQKATCKIVNLSNGKSYYDIYGDNFGGKGSFIDDGMTVIIEI